LKLAGTIIIFTVWVLLATPASAASIVNSVHNLSPSGPGEVHAAEESGVCEFCHTAHEASPAAPLWNRRSQGSTYTPYSSSTALALPGQPTGASLLCLSCHDGTVALGEVLSRSTPILMAGGVTTMPPGKGYIGTDLRHHHPISFVYDSNLAGRRGELAIPSSLPPEIQLDSNQQMQCTSCHNAHDDSLGAFLVMPNQNSGLCVECHIKDGWGSSSHRQSNASWNGQGNDPWPNSDETTVAGNACRNCHETHQASGGPRLLRYASEENSCAACHNGNVASQDVMDSFTEFSAHPVDSTSQSHDMAEPAVATDRHVACSDCHNSHKAPDNSGTHPVPQVRGVDLNKNEVNPVTQGYEVCLRCHADSPGKPAPLVTRQHNQGNLRAEIQLINPSFHPIAGPGRNPDVPSLIDPWNEQSIMGCVDCHGSSTAAPGGEARPPHGSAYEPILLMNYETADGTSESAAAYALCYNCHSQDNILSEESSFKYHRKHIKGANTPCSVCHDPHGISATQGNEVNNSHLINFDTTVVFPRQNGVLRFVDEGRFSGSCDLLCHDKDHEGWDYQ